MYYDWNFSRLIPYAGAFWDGVLTTLTLTFLVIVLGTVGGVPLAALLRRRATGFIVIPTLDALRAIPPFVLLLFTYYFLTPQVVGFSISSYWVAVIALSANLAAFTADVIRAATESVASGEVDAAKALGMDKRQVMRHVTMPHVVRSAIPAMTILYIGMLKSTSLAAVINVYEVTFVAQTAIAHMSRSLEAWVVVAATYVAIVVPATYGARALERRLAVGRPQR